MAQTSNLLDLGSIWRLLQFVIDCGKQKCAKQFQSKLSKYLRNFKLRNSSLIKENKQFVAKDTFDSEKKYIIGRSLCRWMLLSFSNVFCFYIKDLVVSIENLPKIRRTFFDKNRPRRYATKKRLDEGRSWLIIQKKPDHDVK